MWELHCRRSSCIDHARVQLRFEVLPRSSQGLHSDLFDSTALTFAVAAQSSPVQTRAMSTDVAAVEETVKRLASHKGVEGIVIVNGDGVPIRTTLDQELTLQYAALVTQLAIKARHMVRELAQTGDDDLQFLRVRSKQREIMIAPGFDKDHQFTLVVVQAADV